MLTVTGIDKVSSGAVAMSAVPTDEQTNVAATMLSMLYMRELRGLQTSIDETLVNVQVSCNVSSHVLSLADCRDVDVSHAVLQTYTADTETDVALGQIGR